MWVACKNNVWRIRLNLVQNQAAMFLIGFNDSIHRSGLKCRQLAYVYVGDFFKSISYFFAII